MLVQCSQHERPYGLRRHVLGANLNDARSDTLGHAQEEPKIEVMGEHNTALLSSPSQQIGVRCRQTCRPPRSSGWRRSLDPSEKRPIRE